MSSLEFTEEMKGYVTLGEVDYDRGFREGKSDRTFIMFHLTICADDIDRFVRDPQHEATARGWVKCEALGGRLPVRHGIVNLFVDTDDPQLIKMRYRLHFADGAGNPLTLSGFKRVKDDPGFDTWTDTSTLYTHLLRGHVDPEAEPTAEIIAAGIINIYPTDFARQLTTFRTRSGSVTHRAQAMGKFGRFFLGKLWHIYGLNSATRKPGLMALRSARQAGVPGRKPELLTETVVDAPPEQVWDVLTDFDRWDEWNPTLYQVTGRPAVGTEVRMKLRLGPITVPMRQRILSVDRPRELVWRSRQPILPTLDVVRRFRIEPLEGGRCRLVQSETIDGFLAPLEAKLLGKAITRGYEDLGQALAKRTRDHLHSKTSKNHHAGSRRKARGRLPIEREIPLFTLDGVKDAESTTHWFWTRDKLGLSFTRFRRGEPSEAVMLIHGLTSSTDMFIMPEHYNLVSYLLDHGYNDVWCLDFRMSNRHSYNLFRHRYTMDDAALYDYPAALAEMRRHIGDKPIHVISHCLGANSFMMSLFGKAIDGVSSVVANSVALTPRIPKWSMLKLGITPFLVEKVLLLPYLDPRWSEEPGLTRGKILSRLISKFHPECDVPACKMLSLMWGTGWPALYDHSNMADVTHRRGGDLFGPTTMNYYRHVYKMMKAGRAVKYSREPKYAELPDDYFQYAGEIETPVLFTTGSHNRVFSDSNIVCHERLERIVPGRHELHVFPGYGHQDAFMGERVADDVFPRLLEFLDKHRKDEPQRFERAAISV